MYLKYITEEKHSIKGLDFSFIMLPVFPLLSVVILKPLTMCQQAKTLCLEMS